MRNFILIVSLQLTGFVLFGQSDTKYRFLVTILDSSQIESITPGTNRLNPTFSDSEVNTLLSRYTVTKFEQAYPASRHKYLQDVWIIESNSAGLKDSLVAAKPSLFGGAEIIEEPQLTYTPNDYGLATSGQKDLDLVRAKDAWDVSQGDPSILIGITDTKFKVDHEDLENQIVSVLSNNTTATNHGTAVAGVAAAQANNSVGISGIGFDCKLVVSDNWASDNEMLSLSNSGIRILNGSWLNRCYTPSFTGQGIYNEIYENGTIACFGAGNGFKHCRFLESYPAAYDHNISVSSVGCEKELGEKSWWPGLPDSIYWDMKDVHWNVIGSYDTYWDPILLDSVVAMSDIHNHNPKVDICAPGYRVRTTTDDGLYTSNGWGTSFASPMVAGNFGLMLSANPCLTPYQLEYGIKTTAHNIYNILENQPFIGKLGAGRLDAGSAVSWADNHDCNSLYTTTFNIKGIELNTVCRPGQTVNAVNPKLKPVIENGTAPYTYKWEAIFGNSTTLNSYTAEQPEIVSSTSPHRAFYRLTVYDNSSVQKVASQIIDIDLVDSQWFDLVVRDSYLDMYDEPNTQVNLDSRDWDIFQSPDLWNRKTQDNGTEHQNPEYFVSNPNYVYTRVRNVGCAANPTGKYLQLYWTKASTGEKWSEDWTTANITGSSGTPVPAGREITTTPIAIPVIQPGGEWITNLPWYPIAQLLTIHL